MKQNQLQKKEKGERRREKTERKKREKKEKEGRRDRKDLSETQRKQKRQQQESELNKILNKQKARVVMPTLFLPEADIIKFKQILDEYQQAKRLYGLVPANSDDTENNLENLDFTKLDDKELARLIKLNRLDFNGEHDSGDFDSSDDSSDDFSDDSSDDSRSSSESALLTDSDSDELDANVTRDYINHVFGFADDSDNSTDEYYNRMSIEQKESDRGVSFEKLTWLKNIGFSQSRAIAAIKACSRDSDILDAVRYLYNTALPKDSQIPTSLHDSHDALSLFNISHPEMIASRNEEEMVLSVMFGDNFEAPSIDLWRIYIDAAIPSQYLAKTIGKSNKSATEIPQHLLEVYFPEGNVYPYEQPLIIFRDESGKIPSRLILTLCLGLQVASKFWVGQPMVYSLISWLTGDSGGEMESLLQNPPQSYLKLAEDDKSLANIIKTASAISTKLKLGAVIAKTSGPLPKHEQLSKGIGVAITLKKDQGTGKTVNGFVSKVLTRGNHPRGVKVQLSDGRVGRVQFLTGLNEQNHKTISASKNTLKLETGIKNLSIKGSKTTSESAPKGAKKCISKSEKPFITSIQNSELIVSPAVVHKAPEIIEAKSFKQNTPSHILDQASADIKAAFERHILTPPYKKMIPQREGLPAFQLKDTILHTIRENRVVIVSGETGCGKSTQVPQYILDDAILSQRGGRCKILVTQPRRVAAIALAERVSSERGEEIGNSVGYHIRMENKMCNKTQLLFCTTGIMLRRLEEGPRGGSVDGGVDDISHIIVDEVHERSVDSDLLLKMLKDLLKVRPDLKIILMSATLNAELFASYYGSVPIVHIPGRTFAVNALFLEDVLAKIKYSPPMDLCKKMKRMVLPTVNRPHTEDESDSDDAIYEIKSKTRSESNRNLSNGGRGGNISAIIKKLPQNTENLRDEDLDAESLLERYPQLQKSGAQTLFSMDTDKIHYPLIEMLVIGIVGKLLTGKTGRVVPGMAPVGKHRGKSNKRGKEASQTLQKSHSQLQEVSPFEFDVDKQALNRGILIFMPGVAEIAAMQEILLNNGIVRSATQNGNLCIALHAILDSKEQRRAFDRPPDGAVKIIIATNVAETSITVDDVVFVIDCGKMKQTQYDPMKGMASLEECWVSKANATQRRGRAGRVQEGTCIHMFTSHKFTTLLEQQPPEIQRVSLEQMCLRIKITPFLRGSIADILSEMVEPPRLEAIEAAVKSLHILGALTEEEELTPLGFHLARLPVDAKIAKFILFGSIFGCLDSALTIAAAMSSKSPFVAPFEKRGLADAKKLEFATGFSDHLTLLNAYNSWYISRRDGFAAERTFLFDNFLSRNTLNNIAALKRQFAEELSDTGFIKYKLRARQMEYDGRSWSDGVAQAIMEVKRKDDHELVKAVLVAALFPNVIKIEDTGKKGGFKCIASGDEAVRIHPSSVNAKTKKFPSRFLVFHEKVKTTQVFIRDCSSVSPFALAFFGGKLTWDRRQRILNLADGWIQFAVNNNAAVTIEAARTAFDELLQMKIENPELDVSNADLVKQIVSLVVRP